MHESVYTHQCVIGVVLRCFRYLVTFSPLMDSREEPQAVIIWDVMTGQKKRGFHCENASVWPIFKSVDQSITIAFLSKLEGLRCYS